MKIRKKILIVDDDPKARQVLGHLFENAGYDVALQNDGEAILQNHFDKPDIVLLDRCLPGNDGLVVCRHLKEQPETKKIPVVMISALPKSDIHARFAGANDFIDKPFEVKHLLKMVEFHVQYGDLSKS